MKQIKSFISIMLALAILLAMAVFATAAELKVGVSLQYKNVFLLSDTGKTEINLQDGTALEGYVFEAMLDGERVYLVSGGSTVQNMLTAGARMLKIRYGNVAGYAEESGMLVCTADYVMPCTEVLTYSEYPYFTITGNNLKWNEGDAVVMDWNTWELDPDVQIWVCSDAGTDVRRVSCADFNRFYESHGGCVSGCVWAFDNNWDRLAEVIYMVMNDAIEACTHTNTTQDAVPGENETHAVTSVCTSCLETVEQTVAACTDADKDQICDLCGGVVAAAELITPVGSNMTLGNELKINFLVKKEDVQNGYTAMVVQDDKEPVEAKLVPYNSSYYAAVYSVAAKEMTDVLTFMIYDADGVPVSEPFTRTIREYAMVLLNDPSQKAELKSVVVDMLNYGTEAQKYFKYNEDAYANADVTEEQQAQYATGDVECVNNQQPIKNFVGANVSLEDSILLNVFFKVKYNASLTAKITFTDYKGNEIEADGEVSKYSSTMSKVVINQIVLADAKRPVTVTLYDGQTVVGRCVESVESYVARNLTNASTGAINMAIMKFATSAYNYLGGTN